MRESSSKESLKIKQKKKKTKGFEEINIDEKLQETQKILSNKISKGHKKK